MKAVLRIVVLLMLAGGLSAQQKTTKEWLLVDSLGYDKLHPAEKKLLDSILPLYHATTADTQKLKLLSDLIESSNDDKVWPKYNAYMLQLIEKMGDRKELIPYKASALNNIGYLADNTGNMQKSIKYYTEALKLREKVNDRKGMAESYINIGFIYSTHDNSGKALAYYKEALSIYEKLNDKHGIAFLYNNIGSLEEDKEKSRAYYKAAIALQKEIGDEHGLADSYSNLGFLFQKANRPDTAIAYYKEALALYEKVGYNIGIAEETDKLSDIFLELGQTGEALRYAALSLETAKQIGYPSLISDAASSLYHVYEKQQQPQLALDMYRLYIKMRDSLNNIEQAKVLASIEYSEKEKAINAQHEKEAGLAAEQSKKQKLIILFVVIIAVVVVIITLIIFRNLQQQKRSKQIIEQQHDLMEEKQREILDSIRYAKRIQEAVLKEQAHVSRHLPSHFVLFQPKDIVSGDFYWSIEKENYWYIAAADCTGHGVPGAFLTILGTSFLNEINASESLLTPGEILDRLRGRMIKELSVTNKDGTETRDGMDISLARLNLASKELMWAGANNPLWVLSEEGSQSVMKEITAHKQPIGPYPQLTPYPNHIVQLKMGDVFYLFTDGFPDQFGGTKNKKFSWKKMKQLLLLSYDKTMEEQKEMLQKAFVEWKGNNEQTDDVCVIGIKIIYDPHYNA